MNAKMTLTYAAALALAAAGMTSSAPSPAGAVDETAELTEMAEQIEIMRLVLVRSINRGCADLVQRRWPGEKPEADEEEPAAGRPGRPGGFGADPATTYERALALGSFHRPPTGPTTQFTSHTRGFYAEDIGVIFTSEIDAPVVPVEGDDDTAPAPDEWNEARDEVRGISRGGVGFVDPAGGDEPTRWAIEPEFVDAAVDAVLATVGRHGLKIEALPDGAAILVALRLNPHALSGYSYGYSVGGGSGPAPPDPAAFLAVGWAGARSTSPKHAVIRVDKHSIETLGDRAADPAVLRREATITVY